MALVSPALVNVLVPATSANLGSGFDVLGLALQLYNRFEVEVVGNTENHSFPDTHVASSNLRSLASLEVPNASGSQFPPIQIQGELGRNLPTGSDNLFFRAFALLYQHLGIKLPSVQIRMFINIPPGCGLGSSATAVIGGLVAANQLLRFEGLGFDKREELLDLAVAVEVGNHPDDVASALLGGLVAATKSEGRIQAVKMHFPDRLKAIIFTPSFQMDTMVERKLLPSTYSRAGVTYATGHVALLLAALQMERYELLGEAMKDKYIHQPTRQEHFPAMSEIIQAAIDAGAHGACLSGSGSSLIALASSHFHTIQQAMQETARSLGVKGTGMILAVDKTGAQVLSSSHAHNLNQGFP